MSAFSECSKKEKDLLTSEVLSKDDIFVKNQTVEKRDLEAPQMKNTFAPHELVAEGSRIAPTVSSFVEGHRRLGGNAHAEKMIIDLHSASQINRGPPGVFPSSRLHLDMLLGRDESYSFADYLDGYDKF